MNINIKTNNIEITAEVRDYLNKKIESFDKLIDKNDESASFNVILARTTKHHQKGDIFNAEINLHIKGKVLHASSEGVDIYAAIDFVKDEIIRELRSYKDKKIGMLKKGGNKIKNLFRGIYKKNDDL